MAEANGPYFIEKFEYVRDVSNREQGVLVMDAAGGDQFAAPMSTSQLKALIEKYRTT